LLRAAGAATVLTGGALWARLSMAAHPGAGHRKLVFVLLRGGMDGLGAAPAMGDPAFAAARGVLGEYAAPVLPLEGPFALHPNLVQLHAMFGRGEAAVVHAVGLPYRERSHFDAQQLLESGGTRPYEFTSGWLGRALQAGQQRGVALTTAVPLLLRGAQEVDSWAPSVLPEPSADLVTRLASLYRGDDQLAQALDRARRLREEGMGGAVAPAAMSASMAPAAPGMAAAEAPAPLPRGVAPQLARKAAELLTRAGGPNVAVIEMGGWDTHANQQAPQGALANNLRQLDGALAVLREALSAPEASDAWQRTVVVVVSEFGREVAINGTQGTDHGTGGAAFVLGGAVRGGKVYADWPGLAPAQRFEGRDLKITTDIRSLLRPVVARQLGVATATLNSTVFPGSGALPDLDLLRA
jgi:uncharacterized protein (DUF1501 family)